MKKNILLTTICPGEIRNIQLALYYLKAYFIRNSAESNSVNIHILSFLPSDRIESIIYQINKKKPHIIGFSCYVWNITNILKIARYIKEHLPNVKIVFGGPEVSPRAFKLIKNYKFIDIVVIGEGEETFKELLELWLNNKCDLNTVDGIVSRKEDKVLINNRRLPIPNLDEIPSPYLGKFIDDKDLKSNRSIPLETMRGCVYKCHYCYYHKEFSNIRYFSLWRVERELKYLLKKEPREIYLMDPTFNINAKRAKQILKLFIKYNKKTNLHVELKAELLDKEMIELLYQAKTNHIEIGVQSTNRKTLKLINRQFDAVSFKKNILLLNKKKIVYEIQLIDGLPGDNYKSLKKSIDWLFALRPPQIKIMRFMLLPGTYLRQQAKVFKIKYNLYPPYYSIKSDTFSREDLIRVGDLRKTIRFLYNGTFFKNFIFAMVEKLGLKFSTIFEEWNSWMKKEHGQFLHLLESGFKDNGKIKNLLMATVFIKVFYLLSEFSQYLCKKYNKLETFEILLRQVRNDGQSFLNRYGIIKETLGV